MKSKFRVTYLIDVVSNDPSDYTRFEDVMADSNVEAMKQVALHQTRQDAVSARQQINSLTGTFEEVLGELMGMRHCFTSVERID